MAITARIANLANRPALRLPRSVMRAARLGEGDSVYVSVENGVIVIRPNRPPYTLNDLVGRITERNRHGESDWGSAARDGS